MGNFVGGLEGRRSASSYVGKQTARAKEDKSEISERKEVFVSLNSPKFSAKEYLERVWNLPYRS